MLKLRRFDNISRAFMDSLNGRIVQTIAIYIGFAYLLNYSGPDQAFSLVLPISTGLTVFYMLRDNNLKRSIIRGNFSVLSIVFAAIIFLVVYPPKLTEWYTIFLLQGFREELFFRFFMLGMFGKWLFPEYGAGLSIRSILLIILNSVFFACVHAQYTELMSLIVVFALGLGFSYFFVKMGLIPSVILHATWNIYLPIRWPAILFFLVLLAIYWYRTTIRPKAQKARAP